MYIPKEGEKMIEGEDGVKVVVEKTFWQKYVWLLFIHFKSVCLASIAFVFATRSLSNEDICLICHKILPERGIVVKAIQ